MNSYIAQYWILSKDFVLFLTEVGNFYNVFCSYWRSRQIV